MPEMPIDLVQNVAFALMGFGRLAQEQSDLTVGADPKFRGRHAGGMRALQCALNIGLAESLSRHDPFPPFRRFQNVGLGSPASLARSLIS